MQELRNRAVIENIDPIINGGSFAVKRIVDEDFEVSADIFGDGHDIVNAVLYYKHQFAKTWSRTDMLHEVNDRWTGVFTLSKVGAYEFYIKAWMDYALNWQHELKRKVDGGQHVNVELLDGIQYIDAVKARDAETKAFLKKAKTLFKSKTKYAEALDFALSDELKAIFLKHPFQTFITQSANFRVWADRKKAGFSSWYEFFPRSSGEDPRVHGTFQDAIKRLPYVAEMGFDVVYFPPIHPIGEKNRKGRNNATVAGPDDVGSPWAIGSRLGGHKDINPALGTLADFRKFVAEANKLGIEVALDYALQCAPDHPYVEAHPQWFKWRPDGTVQYAENPPKKYQDILPINFESDDWENLWNELVDILFYWIDQGVKIFRVDNPHTKPFRFWEWAIAKVREKHPEVLFLSEAFTRPKIMHQLAKAGFSQSYTYFTWRTSKTELETYINELVSKPSREYFRPNFWPNTPDILPYQLQQPNEAVFLSRYFMAASLSGNYGMYGPVYENMEYRAVPGKEEYSDSEKYELVKHNWDLRGKLKQVIKSLNAVRKSHPALQDTYNTRICRIDNPNILAYFKMDKSSGDALLCAVNLDPHYTQAGWVQVPIDKLGIGQDKSYEVKDLISGANYSWKGEWNYVELNPNGLPFHCFGIQY